MKKYLEYFSNPDKFVIPDKALALRMCPDEEVY